MFTYTSTKTTKRTTTPVRETILSELFDELDQLEEKLEDQRRFKKNKEYFLRRPNLVKFYYYLREEDVKHDTTTGMKKTFKGHPKISVCLLYDLKNNIACRGMSICHYEYDNFEREDGRDWAEDRAIMAYETEETTEKIENITLTNFSNKIKNQLLDYLEHNLGEYNVFKSQYSPKHLTGYEHLLINKAVNRYISKEKE